MSQKIQISSTSIVIPEGGRMSLRAPSELDNVFQDHLSDIRQLASNSSRHEKIRVDK